MAEESVESNGCCAEKAFEDELSLPGTESGVSPEDRSVSSDSFHDGSMPRRNSTGKPSPKAAKEKIVPHYLRASTGSCHDFCKYGRKDAFDEEEVRPWRKKNNKAQSSKQKVSVYILEEGKRVTVEKEAVLPLRTQDTVMTASLGEGKKAMELEKRTQSPSKVRVQMASPDRKRSPAIAALSGEKKKVMVDKKAASTDRQKSPAIITPSGEKKKAVVHMQMASPDRKLRPTGAAFSGEKKKAGMHVQMASPDWKLRPTVAALSVVKQKATVHKQMASPDRKLRPTVAALSVEKQKATVHKQMASSAMVSSGEKKNATIKQFTSPVRASISSKQKFGDHPETIKREVLYPSKNVGAYQKDPSLHKNSKVEKQMNKSSSKRSPGDSLIKKLSSLRSLRSSEKPEKAGKTETPTSSPDGVYERSERRDNITSDKNRVVAKPAAKNVQVHPIRSSSPSVTKKKAESSKLVVDQNSAQKAKMGKSENENIPEKTLHVVLTESISILSEPAADNEVVPPLPSEEDAETEGEGEFESDEEVEGDFDDSDSFDEDEDGDAYEEEVDDIASDQKGTAGNNVVKSAQGSTRKSQRKGWVLSESKDPTPVKVKFRRGRIVDLQSDSNANAPRRLRFRQRRSIDEKHSDHLTESRNRSKKEADGNGNGNAAHPDNVKVVLRHQDAQEKKDEQGLFNNVIEETASKLVESRKSKVKALVGAFETVISLQDAKPSSQTVS